jgi:hypothetical protein
MKQGNVDYHPPRSVIAVCLALAASGSGAVLVGLSQSPERIWPNLLLVSYYLLSLGLGGLVFVALQYITGAGWSVAFRRVPEAMAAILPVAAIGLGVVFLARPSLYSWTDSPPASTPLQEAWYNWSFFLVRAAIYLATWFFLGRMLVRTSRLQDKDGDPIHTRQNVRTSAAFLVVFAVTFSLASFDWLMSLEPEWYSTIFAVYQFAGLFLGGLAGIIVLITWLRWLGPFRQVITREHLHDLGKLLFGFSNFWMYLWFCQYMLIWYVNNPEETIYFRRRLAGPWELYFFLNVVLNWGIPFLVLLPRATKQCAGVLAAVSLVVLAGRWVDLYLGILPYTGEPTPASVAWEASLAAGGAGLFALVFFASLGKAAPIPVNDPFLLESMPALREKQELLSR